MFPFKPLVRAPARSSAGRQAISWNELAAVVRGHKKSRLEIVRQRCSQIRWLDNPPCPRLCNPNSCSLRESPVGRFHDHKIRHRLAVTLRFPIGIVFRRKGPPLESPAIDHAGNTFSTQAKRITDSATTRADAPRDDRVQPRPIQQPARRISQDGRQRGRTLVQGACVRRFERPRRSPKPISPLHRRRRTVAASVRRQANASVWPGRSCSRLATISGTSI